MRSSSRDRPHETGTEDDKIQLNVNKEARIKIGRNSYRLSALLDATMLNAFRQNRAQESEIVQHSPMTVQ